MIGKVIGFYVNAGTGAVRLALNVTTGTLKLVGNVAERAMGVSHAPSAEPGYKKAAAAAARATETPAETAERDGGGQSEPEAEPETRERAPEAEAAPQEPSTRVDEPEAAPETRERAPEAEAAPETRERTPEPESEAAPPEPSTEPPEESPPERPPAVDYDATPPTPIDRAEADAKTVDEEPELVAEFAERGAENGAGANATVDEPWEDYAQMNADAIIARIGEADLAELAVVELYEQTHGKRQTVLEAAERRHRSLTGPGASQ